ncbi:helix-turn-helix domain-containing protein [Streptosporangium sp. NBC_01755]|uniref:helix-turn-helix domain-containing protein n=1 Tax=Streptosporangium sp. NBC_01755 TaxID=2975949 RepID=UPI002DD9248A|nr:helix-turn-helix transcriptional regulator [Streptosporangium sp. NBC_01755]WSD01533.1 helix-turn-helix domain-containing protein [Streptosporangium sp. NBC_01755]
MDEKPRTPEDRARLAREVKRRRQQLGLTQTQLVAVGGPSVSLISKIESRKPGPYDGMSILRLERALQWQEGSIDAVLDGGSPTSVNASSVITPETATTKAVIPQPAVTAISAPKSPSESAMEDTLLSHLEAMARQQAELMEEIKGLRKQVEDLQRIRDQQDPGNRASA